MKGFEKIRIRRVLPPMGNGTAVHLGNTRKTFVMYVGLYEGAAILRELKGESAVRPLTHDLLDSILHGFDIDVKRVLISDIIQNTFCATLVLEVTNHKGSGEKRSEVRIDARPSDCLVIALKKRCDIWCARTVLDRVKDVSEEGDSAEDVFDAFPQAGWKEPEAEESPDADPPEPEGEGEGGAEEQ